MIWKKKYVFGKKWKKKENLGFDTQMMLILWICTDSFFWTR